MKSYNINVLIWHQDVFYSELFTKNKQDAGVWFNVNDSCCQHVERSGEGRGYRTTKIIQKLVAHLQIQRVTAEKMKIIFCCKHVMQQTNKHQYEKVFKQCNSDSSSFNYQVTQNERMRTFEQQQRRRRNDGGEVKTVAQSLIYMLSDSRRGNLNASQWREKVGNTRSHVNVTTHISEFSVFHVTVLLSLDSTGLFVK